MRYFSKTLHATTAWKYVPETPIPVWVARKCHFLGDGKFTCNMLGTPVPIELGDYVCMVDEETNTVAVVNGPEFEAEYAEVHPFAVDLDCIEYHLRKEPLAWSRVESLYNELRRRMSAPEYRPSCDTVEAPAGDK